MKKLLFFFISILFTSCNVHEFPEEESRKRIPFLLNLNFNTEMPLHQEIIYARSGDVATKGATSGHDIRYTNNAYRNDDGRGNSRVAEETFILTKSNHANLNHTAQLELEEGTYDFRIWADYVEHGSDDDKYYDTSNFSEIILANKDNHPGSNDYRDAFRGYASAQIAAKGDNQVTAEMKRPMGKFKFVSTDVDLFLSRVVEMMQNRGLLADVDMASDSKAAIQSINLNDFKVVFRYNAFMPCSFNMFTDKPADSWTGMSFTSNMQIENEKEMALGHDYIFVNGTTTTLSLSVEVYNKEGELLSSTRPIDVPIVRSKLTVVRGEFLTSKATGGVSINPGYDGEDYNIEIY